MSTSVESSESFFSRDRLRRCLLDIDSVVCYEDQWSKSFISSVEEFADKPELLDPFLNQICQALVGPIRLEALGLDHGPKCSGPRVSGLARMMNALVRVRGRKVCSRFFPHEVMDLSAIVRLLERLLQPTTTVGASPTGPDQLEPTPPTVPEFVRHWEGQFLLFVWISVLLLSPFDVSALEDEDAPAVPLADRITAVCKHHLGHASITRDAAAHALAQLLIRPDMQAQRGVTLDWALGALDQQTGVDGDRDTLHCGLLTFLAHTLKRGQRTEIKAALESRSLVNRILILAERSQLTKRKEHTKQWAKLCGRIALLYLPVNVSGWHNRQRYKTMMQLQSSSSPVESSAHDEFEVDETVEQVIDLLIRLISDKDSSTRWCASKSLAEVTSRLPEHFAHELIDMIFALFPLPSLRIDTFSLPVIDHFESPLSVYTWHGAVLSLAEFCMRGLLPYNMLPSFVNVCKMALTLEKEGHSERSICVGVRDAACYACWALAHSYEPTSISTCSSDLLIHLLCVCLFDREVNCRRAAAAALQEHIGRQGSKIEDGISIITSANFFSLSNRIHSFTEIALKICELRKSFFNFCVHFLSMYKCHHWDVHIRKQASEAIMYLCSSTSVSDSLSLFETESLSQLFEFTFKNVLSFNTNKRHGSLVCLNSLISSFPNHVKANTSVLLQSMNELIARKVFLSDDSCRVALLQAICSFVDSLTLPNSRETEIDLDDETPSGISDETMFDSFFDFVNDCLVHSEKEVHLNGAELFFSLVKASKGNKKRREIIQENVEKWLNELKKVSNNQPLNDSFIHGCICVLGVCLKLPVFQALTHSIIHSFIQCIHSKALTIETRQATIHSLIQSFQQISTQLPASIHSNIFTTLLKCMNDYTTDSRGDVGSWIRMSSVNSVNQLVSLNSNALLWNEMELEEVKKKLISLAIEKMLNIRRAAVECLKNILIFERQTLTEPNENHAFLCTIFLDSKEVTTECVLRCCLRESYMLPLIDGLCLSLGALSKSVVEEVSKPFFVLANDLDEVQLKSIAFAFVSVLADSVTTGRRLSAILRSFHVLLIGNVFVDLFDSTFGLQVVQLTTKAMSKAKSSVQIQRLCASIFAGSLALYDYDEEPDTPVENRFTYLAMKQMMLLLGCPYPTVRKFASEQIFSLCVVSRDELETRLAVSQEALTQVKAVLSASTWDGSVKEARDQRNKLCSLLGYPSPKLIVK